ncbi:urease accessory protein UreE [Marinomonas agarivorans]|nr:urease accessory protein UreE [Marinomonas agarivorans]
MIDIYERLGTDCEQKIYSTVVLTHEQRERGRLKLVSESGEEVRVFLDRGQPLQVGECLKAECGRIIQVIGALESVTYASCDDWDNFAKACYHLGNRHTKIQIGERWLYIKPDHVLEEMLHLLGLTTQHQEAVFIPEAGAYAHGHRHD